MKNYVQKGDALDMVAPSGGVVSGGAYLIGSIFGVAEKTVAQGETFAMERKGVFILPKADSQAWTLGVKLYWDNTAKNVTTTSSGNTLIGAAAEVLANTSGIILGKVLLDGTIR